MNVAEQRLKLKIEIKRRELQAEIYEKYHYSLANFIKDAWAILEPGAPYVHGWHIDAMCDHLQAVTDGKIQNLLINVPPGMMKSLLVSVFWPAWEWGVRRLAHYKYVCASHSKALAIRDNLRMRRLVTSDWYQLRFPDAQLTSDQAAKIKFENKCMGSRTALASGSITGERGDRVIIDDPHSVESAHSDAQRASTKMWFTEAVPTRLNIPDKSSIVVIMQRLHEEDVSGIILDNHYDYEHLNLPMEFEADNCCETSIGFKDPRTTESQLIFPERFNREIVDNLKKTMGTYATAGQFQQRPTPRGGGIIKVEWLNVVDKLPAEFSYIVQAYDTAFKVGNENDYTVGTTWGVKDGQFYLLHRLKGRFEFPELEKKMKETVNYYNPHMILIEDKASGQSIIQVLRHQFGSRIKPITPDKDKVTRAHAVSTLFENHLIHIYNAPWTDDYIKNLTRFPHAKHDDDVDSTTMALNYLNKTLKSQLRFVPGSNHFTR